MKRFFNENHNRFTVNMKKHSHNSDTSARKILISLSGAALFSSLISSLVQEMLEHKITND